MATLRLFWKIVALHAVLTILATVLSLLVLVPYQKRRVSDRLEESLAKSAAAVAVELSAGGDSLDSRKLQATAQRLGKVTGWHVTFVETDGTVVADSHSNPDRLENVRHRGEFVDARNESRGVAIDDGPEGFGECLYVAVQATDQESPTHFVRVGASRYQIDREVQLFQHRLVSTAVGVSLVALLIAVVVVHRVTQPLESLTRVARAIALGDTPPVAHIESRDELGVLSEAFRLLTHEQLSRIAELQQKSRDLEKGSELLSTVLGGMIEGVVAINQEERILFANQAARVMLDLHGAEAIGRPVWEVVRNPRIQEVVRTALAGGENLSVEIELPRSQTTVALLASRLPGTPCPGAVLVLHDVTDLRRLENLRREFVSNVSHELKTPLTAIQAYTETLQDGAIDNPRHNREFLGRIAEQADRLHKLILDLLRLARIESGKDVFEVVAVPLDRVVESCVEEHLTLAKGKGVTIRVERPSAALRVQADADGLRTILDNLIDNAVKYTPPGGTVTVRWRPAGRQALLEVEDTGVGIDAPHLARIFERFYRVDKARSREMGGTGLGLAIVKHLTQVFEGKVEVESQPGSGSTFSVWLPLVK